MIYGDTQDRSLKVVDVLNKYNHMAMDPTLQSGKGAEDTDSQMLHNILRKCRC